MSEHSADLGPASMPDAVERWEISGGTWEVVWIGPAEATVDLLRCDGGEVVETLTLTDPLEVRWAGEQV